MTPEERFLSLVQFSVDRSHDGSPCVEWATAEGYAKFKSGGRQTGAHRWAYEHWVGPIPDGLQIDHLCRNRCCVNPAHLEPVTAQENTRRALAFRVPPTHCKWGHELTGEKWGCLVCHRNRVFGNDPWDSSRPPKVCGRGHPLEGDGAELYVRPDGRGFQCKPCVRERTRKRDERRRLAGGRRKS